MGEARMKNEALIYAAAAALCLGSLFTPGKTHAAKHRNFSIGTEGDANGCADLRVRSSGELARVNQSFTLSKGEAPILEMNSADHGQIRVRAWDHADYSVETCKIAVADTRGTADQILGSIEVRHTAGNVSFSGPASDD